MSESYDPTSLGVIHKREQLWGWNKKGGLLDILLDHVRSHGNFFLYGERYSGKTSLVSCVKHELELENGHWLALIIKLSTNELNKAAYRAILKQILRELKARAQKGAPWSLDKLNEIEQTTLSPLDMDEALYRLEELMKEHKRSLLLIFDNADLMPRCFPDMPGYFYDFTARQDEWEHGVGGINCAFASSEPSEFFPHTPGSIQFNKMEGRGEKASPLELPDFTALWESMTRTLSDEERERLAKRAPNAESAYELCGGRPGFAKKILDCWRRKPEVENPLENELKSIYERQSIKARGTLLRLAFGEPVKDTSKEKRLEDFCLIRPDMADGLPVKKINGELFKQYLLGLITKERAKFDNAGQLAAKIVKGPFLEKFLRLYGERGEWDWLEYKACCIPPQKRIDQDNKKEGKQNKPNDYVMRIIESIIAMRNTRGGLLVLGVDDLGAILGLEKTERKGGTDICGDIKKKLAKHNFDITEDGLKITVNLSGCEWNLDDEKWINFIPCVLEGKQVLAIIVYPLKLSFNNCCLRRTLEGNAGDLESATFVRKNFRARNVKITKEGELEKHRENLGDNSDLKEIWRYLIRQP